VLTTGGGRRSRPDSGAQQMAVCSSVDAPWRTTSYLQRREDALWTRLGIAEPLVVLSSFVGAPLLRIGAASSTVSHGSDGRRAVAFREAMQGGGAS
jgi:hypothetical protein